MSESANTPETRKPRHGMVAVCCLAFVAAMIGAAYAAVPFYNMFCRLTGYAGTTQRAAAAPGRVLDRSFEVRFDSNMNGGLPWKFTPEATSVTVKAGEVKTVYYKVTNFSHEATRGVASYNVTPMETGAFFSKIQCFCFSDQSLKPGETRELPVVFFIDPAIADDKALDNIATITLSYTFYPAVKPATPVAAATSKPQSPQL